MARTKGAVGKGVDNKDVRDYLLGKVRTSS